MRPVRRSSATLASNDGAVIPQWGLTAPSLLARVAWMRTAAVQPYGPQVGAEGPTVRNRTVDNPHAMRAPSREENVAGW
jgi:hypothetical protein